MSQKHDQITVKGAVLLLLALLNAIVLEAGYVNHPKWYSILLLTAPLLLIRLFLFHKKTH
ncbi:MAG TPA: hypothetical protein VHK91_03625 [Flavisolibacter sp.]|nr:hypothetical protein [Flavisolibacter sp.]